MGGEGLIRPAAAGLRSPACGLRLPPSIGLGLFENEVTVFRVGGDLVALVEFAVEDLQGERIEDFALDHALERTRPVGGIIALGGKPIAGVRLQRDDDLAIR